MKKKCNKRIHSNGGGQKRKRSMKRNRNRNRKSQAKRSVKRTNSRRMRNKSSRKKKILEVGKGKGDKKEKKNPTLYEQFFGTSDPDNSSDMSQSTDIPFVPKVDKDTLFYSLMEQIPEDTHKILRELMKNHFDEAIKNNYNDLKKYALSPEIGKSLFLLLNAPSDKDFKKHGYTLNDITQEEFPTMFQQGIPHGCNPVGCAKVSIKGTDHAEQVKSFFELVKKRKEEEKLIEEDERAFEEEDNAARKIQKAFRNKGSQQAKKMAETKEKSKN